MQEPGSAPALHSASAPPPALGPLKTAMGQDSPADPPNPKLSALAANEVRNYRIPSSAECCCDLRLLDCAAQQVGDMAFTGISVRGRTLVKFWEGF